MNDGLPTVSYGSTGINTLNEWPCGDVSIMAAVVLYAITAGVTATAWCGCCVFYCLGKLTRETMTCTCGFRNVPKPSIDLACCNTSVAMSDTCLLDSLATNVCLNRLNLDFNNFADADALNSNSNLKHQLVQIYYTSCWEGIAYGCIYM